MLGMIGMIGIRRDVAAAPCVRDRDRGPYLPTYSAARRRLPT